MGYCDHVKNMLFYFRWELLVDLLVFGGSNNYVQEDSDNVRSGTCDEKCVRFLEMSTFAPCCVRVLITSPFPRTVDDSCNCRLFIPTLVYLIIIPPERPARGGVGRRGAAIGSPRGGRSPARVLWGQADGLSYSNALGVTRLRRAHQSGWTPAEGVCHSHGIG